MKQLLQNFKTGEMAVKDIDIPALSEGMVLVQNKFSLISAGTEKNTVKMAQASFIGKAKQRPDLVRKVIQNVKKEGIKATLEKVRTMLDTPKALGYSSAGVVLMSMDTNGVFKPGMRVACAGQDYASHAEIITVPQNLVVKIPDGVSFEDASFTTLGSIAMQGLRQSDSRLGENVLVIGLGLLGQISCQLFIAGGCNVFGIDLSEDSVRLALSLGVHAACVRTSDALKQEAIDFTRGNGFDSIIIAAATPSNDPIEVASELAHKKAKIIVLGSIGMALQRDPYFYRKELELIMSCSYGPGRYDPRYEEHGIDYPYSYVRWTEQRNMESFLRLLDTKKINIKPLISHIFNIEDAVDAFDIVMGKKQVKFVGILLKYKDESIAKENIIFEEKKPVPVGTSKDRIGFIGAGSFAQSYLIPYINKSLLETVVTNKGYNTYNVATKFGFLHTSTNALDIINNNKIGTVFIATRHDSHTRYVIQCLQKDKNIFVEKPLSLTYDELETIISEYQKHPASSVMVGFNRRFSPLALYCFKKMCIGNNPLLINYRINAGHIPSEHWTQDPLIGGGRIIGEVCHFIDLMQFFTKSFPTRVFAQSITPVTTSPNLNDTLSINLQFENGSVGVISYAAIGDISMPKEYIEIFGGSKSFIIDDFKCGYLFDKKTRDKIRLSGKGHKEEVLAFLDSIGGENRAPISFKSICYTTLATFKIIDSIRTGLPQDILL